MKFDIKHFELLYAIDTEGSLTKAAEKLFLTQSALSHQLKDLEERLDTKLFIRSKKKLYLTEIGKEILSTGNKVLEDVRKLENKISARQKNINGTIRISTEGLTSYHWVPSILKKFIDRGHDVKFEVVLEATHNPLEYLRQGKLDTALTYQKTNNPNFKFTPLFDDEFVVVVSKNHRLAKKKHLKYEDFINENVFIYDSPNENNDILQQIFSSNDIAPKYLSKVGLTEAILELVCANLGISIMANWIAKRNLECCHLAAIPFAENKIKRTWYLAELKEPSLKSLELFKEFLVAYFSKDQLRTNK